MIAAAAWITALIARAGLRDVVLVGPAPCPIDRIKDRWRWHLLIKLQTGRFHQIRILCAGLGLPLAGDPLYDPARREPADFYLEHVLFKHTDFDSRLPATYFLPELQERGPVDGALVGRLAALAGI